MHLRRHSLASVPTDPDEASGHLTRPAEHRPRPTRVTHGRSARSPPRIAPVLIGSSSAHRRVSPIVVPRRRTSRATPRTISTDLGSARGSPNPRTTHRSATAPQATHGQWAARARRTPTCIASGGTRTTRGGSGRLEPHHIRCLRPVGPSPRASVLNRGMLAPPTPPRAASTASAPARQRRPPPPRSSP